MEIKDLKQAEAILEQTTKDSKITEKIYSVLTTWNFQDFDETLDPSIINELIAELNEQIFTGLDDEITEALHWFIFDKIYDVCFNCIRYNFSEKDCEFFEKCKTLSASNVSAEQFGAEENYCIPLSAAIVELSVIDKYKSPKEKMTCLCNTFDWVYAEIKSAIVAFISQNSDKENDIPIIDNKDIIPVLMVVIIKSKLSYIFSNLYYIKSFCHRLELNHIFCNIFHSFENAVESIAKIDVKNLCPSGNKVINNIDVEHCWMLAISSGEEERKSKSLVDEANKRAMNLINRAISEEKNVPETVKKQAIFCKPNST